MAEVLRDRPRVRGKPLLLELLGDLESGACSVLEREYLGQVERRHGLPEGRRQNKASSDGRSVYRDVDYEDFALIVELDGRAFHDSAGARDRDAGRDLSAAVEQGALTVRLTYGQVFGSSCLTAARIGQLLKQRGWTGTPMPCPNCPNCAAS